MISPQVGEARNHDLTPSRAKYLFLKMSKLALGPTQPLILWISGALYWQQSIHGVKLTTQVFLVPWLRMSAALPELSPICLHGMDRGNCTYTYRSTWCHIPEGHSSYLLLYKPKLIYELKKSILLVKNTSKLSVPF